MATDIDLLMSLDPLELTKDGPEIAAIIAYYRNNRAKEGADGKMKKGAKAPGEKPALDLTELIQGMASAKAPTAAAPISKPSSGGFKRL